MKRALTALALALFLAVAGCTSRTPPAPTNPTPNNPAPTIPTTVGATRYGVGPGLVVEGYTPLKKLHVELKQGATVLQKADVEPKDDGWYRVTWPAPAGAAEVIVSADGKELVRGALADAINVGLFYGPGARRFQVDFHDPKALTTLALQGSFDTTATKATVELRDGAKVLATHEVPLSSERTLSAKVPMAAGARHVWVLIGNQPMVVAPIVTH
ncbi:MAG: hypothetical protein K0R39_4588 [Symbiobacteriaceae bacterium]|jgi:hypothetical protein|nr:hypothetical protein [Symbiobacteriaceae bacterium]